MGRIIFSIVVLVVIAALIVLNAGAVAPFNLFGHTFTGVPVIVIAICGFVVGVLYSFVYYLMRAVARLRQARMQGKTDRLQERVHEAEAAAQQAEASAQQAEATARQAAKRGRATGSSATTSDTVSPPEAPARRSLFSRLFGDPD
jgi:uncharacterized integral membrane protein